VERKNIRRGKKEQTRMTQSVKYQAEGAQNHPVMPKGKSKNAGTLSIMLVYSYFDAGTKQKVALSPPQPFYYQAIHVKPPNFFGAL
jgi:hypothetical protein